MTATTDFSVADEVLAGLAADAGATADWDLDLIHEAVSARAALAPGDTALFFRGERIDYATLDAAAAGYASVLRGFGVGPGAIVPVALPRSPALVAMLLAVLRCGAAYAAFDLRWPGERRAELVERLDAPVYVTSVDDGVKSLVWYVPQLDLAEAAAAEPGDDVRVRMSAEEGACVFFTSGTTGKPKGVVSPHRATTRLFARGLGSQKTPGLLGYHAGAVGPQAAPAPWDAFTWELWGMLTVGGAVAIVEDDYLLPGMLRDLVRDQGVNTVFLTASLLNAFIDMDIDCFEGLRYLYTGGERLSVNHMERFLRRFPEIQLRNGYGPVESCVIATSHLIELDDCALKSGIPIGSACPATGVYVLNGSEVLPAGTPGEICISGTGLALGYLNDPDQTSAKFVEVDIDGEAVRVYRTGDLGCFDEKGVLHFQGRIDRQVKVRGYRIEPGEIETVAAKLEDVQSCAVVPVPGKTQVYDRLALFYVATPDAPEGEAPGAFDLDRLNVTDRLADVLPAYLVPDVVAEVAELPLTANGKLDAAALLKLIED
jgi:amino acid adenylation domain-containing protein